MTITAQFTATVLVAFVVIVACAWHSARTRTRRAAREIARRADERRVVRQQVADITETCNAQAFAHRNGATR